MQLKRPNGNFKVNLMLKTISTFLVCFLCIAYVGGNIACGYGNSNLKGLLKKYGVKLNKPVYIKLNLSRQKTGQVRSNDRGKIYRAVRKNHNGNSVDKRKNKARKIMNKIVSLSGSGSLKSALMLLSREIGIPIVIHRGLPSKLKSDVYYENQPLRRVLYGLVKANGLKYIYRGGSIIIYPFVEKTYHIPVLDLFSSFSATVGIAGNGAGSSNAASDLNTNEGALDSGLQSGATNSAASSVPSSQPQSAALQGGMGSQSQNGLSSSSNPSGSLSLTLSESGSLYDVISANLKKMISKKGRFFINPKDGLIWVRDRESHVRAITGYMKNIKKFLSKQVFLKVEVLDVNLNKNFQMGINWNMLFNSAFKANPAGLDSFAISAPLAANNNIVSSPYIQFNGSGANAAVLNALQTQGTVNVISQPRLLLMDGQTRLISSGTITPYVSSIQTDVLNLSQTQTYPVISQVQTGLSISFTPHINFKNNTVSVTLSLIDNSISSYQAFSIGGESLSNPVIESKSFADTVNVKSGSTVIIGGILTSQRTKNTYGVPLLSQIPLFGKLFKSINISDQKEDLLIMLTPVIAD